LNFVANSYKIRGW